MKEISLNVLDIAENSVKAGAALTEISIEETETKLSVSIKDNGCGMDEETLNRVTDPFYTTRTTRKVGLGIPLFKEAAEQTGGSFSIWSRENVGTHTNAVFNKDHLDCMPLGDIISTVTTLIQGHPDSDFLFTHKTDKFEVSLDTRKLRIVLEDVPLNTYEVIKWIEENLNEQYLMG